MEPVRIFVASSSEGEVIAKHLRSLLQDELRSSGIVEMWRSKFELGKVAIEALEAAADKTDFAILVMTPDDISVSRHKEELAPRDNLVFELGLFIGALGRERSVVVRETEHALKLPSDVLGVTALTYVSSSPEELSASLQAGCVRLAEHITKVGVRLKWSARGRAALVANGEFYREVEGAWWERINHPGGSALSFFRITPDPLAGSLSLEGTGYGPDGEPSALWNSEMARLYPSERRITYLWRGKHPLPGLAHLKFHGYGSMEFKPPDSPASQLTQGVGDFWDVNEARPAGTVSKPVELRRIVDEKHIRLMSTGNAKDRPGLVRQVIETW